MHISQRFPHDLSPSELAQTLTNLSAHVVDLTVSNPTQVGFTYDEETLGEAFRAAAREPYQPLPLGLPQARHAISGYLQKTRNFHVPASRVIVTSSTSEAYSLLFKLLCNPNETIAVPVPSYPLVPHLAELEAVKTVPYAWRFDQATLRWQLDITSVEAALKEHVRAVVAISPNNPTGSIFSENECQALWQLCRRYDVPLIADEVFAPYTYQEGSSESLGQDTAPGPLTFVLDGLSKAAGLPQLKLSWMTLFGESQAIEQATLHLEWLMDAYLSVSGLVQHAAPTLLSLAIPMQQQIRRRLKAHWQVLASAIAPLSHVQLLPASGGFNAVLQLPEDWDEEALVTHLACQHQVLVQPGFFYDFQNGTFIVLSLLPEPDLFLRGVANLVTGLSQGRSSLTL